MKPKRLLVACLSSLFLLIIVAFIVILQREINRNAPANLKDKDKQEETTTADPFLLSDRITQDLLPVNEYSRPGTSLKEIKGIVIHYVGNPGTTAAQNKSYFAGLATSGATSASSHYIVGLDGEIIQCVPLNEISYASNDRNKDTIAIECCHPDETGQFNDATYASLVELTAALCNTYGLNPEKDVIRHYDVTGKKCPLYYVDHEDKWYEFKLAVRNAMHQ